jgi:hypothetical protein
MPEKTMGEWALFYASLGWPVFPCHPKQKIPLTEHGVKDATTDEATIRAWWARWPTANIGLACGTVVSVVDVDNKNGVNGWESLKEFPALPATVVSLTPTGGAHFLFLGNPPPRNKNSFRDGIDIRGEGYYIILPPSIHPCGEPYQWRNLPGETPLADFPEFMRPVKPLRPWDAGYQQQIAPPKPVPANPPTSPQGTPILERASLYLRECQAAVQGQAGHDKLLWAARAMVVGFDLDDGTALRLLWGEFNPRCIPPWDASSPSEAKDFERKVSEARQTPGEKPRGWLLDEYGLRKYDADAEQLAYGRRLLDGLLAGHERQKASKEPPPAGEPTPRACREPSTDIPKWLLDPPGMVGEMARWINQTALRYQPLLSLQASIVACGAAFGRKVRDETPNGRTNIYAIGVAKPSSGKDHPGDCIGRLFARAGGANYLAGYVTSDSAVEFALSEHPVMLLIWDEIAHYFAQIRQAGLSSGSQHLTSIIPALMSLYSSAHKLWIGKARADGLPRKTIEQPHVCLWGLTTPEKLYGGLNKSELTDGWLSRIMVIVSDAEPPIIQREDSPLPESLVTQVAGWVTRVIPAIENMGDIRGAITPNQIVIRPHPKAAHRFQAFNEECEKLQRAVSSDIDPTVYLWGRALQNARRHALILAAGENFDGAEISEENAEWACQWVKTHVLRFRHIALTQIADNPFEREKQKLRSLINSFGSRGLSKSEFTRKTQSIRDRKMRDAYLEEMREAGWIDMGMHPKKKATWIWTAPYGMDILAGKSEGDDNAS